MESLSGTHVRLRSRLRGTYLHADEDGVTVSLTSDRTSINTLWRVEAVRLRYLRGNFVGFQSAAYGRYLAASSEDAEHGVGCVIHQKIVYGAESNVDALWLPLTVWGASQNEFNLRHCRYSTRYLGVAGQDADEMSATSWIFERVPWRRQPPVLPNPLRDPRSQIPLKRTVIFARHDGPVTPSSWRRMVFHGRSVRQLTAELAGLLGEPSRKNISLFVWTGYHGPWIPLVVDLPATQEALAIGVVSRRSSAASGLRYPDADAE